MIDELNNIYTDKDAFVCKNLLIFYLNIEVIIYVDLILQQLFWVMYQGVFSTNKIQLEIAQEVWSIDVKSRLNKCLSTSFGLFRSGAQKLISNSISDIFISVFESWASMKAREWLDGVVKVSMTQISGYSWVDSVTAH